MTNIKPAAPAPAPTTTSNESRIAALESQVETLFGKVETDVKTDWQKFETWVKDNVVHLAGYSGVIAAILHRL